MPAVARPSADAERRDDGTTREARASWLSTAMQAWDDTRTVLMRFDADVTARELDPRRVPREVRRALDAIRRADRTRPAFIDLSPPIEGLGEEPRDPSWTETQMRRAQAAARALRVELERSQAELREMRRRRPAGGAFDQAAEVAEQTITSILRPLSLAVATSTAPVQRGLGSGLGLGLAALAALFLFR